VGTTTHSPATARLSGLVLPYFYGNHDETGRGERDRVMVLLSVNAGLRAIEISKVTWGMVLDAGGHH